LFWRSLAVLSALCAATAPAATRPRYGGTLRLEVHIAPETADPPQPGDLGPARRLAELLGPFRIVRWEPGRRAVFAADEACPSGRPFVDAVEIEMGRGVREQFLDLEMGKADMVEAGPGETRRPAAGRRLWSSSPVRLLALVANAARPTDPAARQALALAIDRAAIHNVLLQRQGEISGGILPQWLSGYAFVFRSSPDLVRARGLAAGLPAAARSFTLSYDQAAPQARSIAERIALNARDAGLAVQVAPGPRGELHLATAEMVSLDPSVALGQAALALGLPEPPRAETPEGLHQVENALLEGYRVIPLFHLPDTWAVTPQVRTWRGPAVNRLGGWQLEDVWLEPGKP
jgi:ABC-type transport system substrate-binding protein